MSVWTKKGTSALWQSLADAVKAAEYKTEDEEVAARLDDLSNLASALNLANQKAEQRQRIEAARRSLERATQHLEILEKGESDEGGSDQ